MLKVGQLLKFLNEINPQTTPGRLALFNYLKAFHKLDEPLTLDMIERFFSLCLEDPHWLRNKGSLGREVQLLLKNFNSFYQGQFDFENLRFPEQTQVIEIENNNDWLEVTQRYGARLAAENEVFRVINDQNKRMVILILKTDRSLDLHVVDRKFTLRHGHFEPLRKQILHYTSQLELSPLQTQFLEVAPHMMSQFQVEGDRLFGVISRGYVFQKFQVFQGEKLHEISRLFWPLKRLEQFFILRKSDPFYLELIRKLESVKAQGAVRDPQWSQALSVLINQSEMALEHIYSDDNRLSSLIQEIKKFHEVSERCLKISPKSESDLTN